MKEFETNNMQVFQRFGNVGLLPKCLQELSVSPWLKRLHSTFVIFYNGLQETQREDGCSINERKASMFCHSFA